MRRDLLEALMLAAMFGGKSPTKPKVLVVENPQYTRNMFGPIEEISGKELELLERNNQGDCLCIFKGSKGTNIVDVDHRDIT